MDGELPQKKSAHYRQLGHSGGRLFAPVGAIVRGDIPEWSGGIGFEPSLSSWYAGRFH